MLIIFLLQDNAIAVPQTQLCIFLHLESLNEKLVFHNLSYIHKHKQHIFSFFTYKTLRVCVALLLSYFFQASFSDGKFISSYTYSQKISFLLFFADLFLNLHYSMRLLHLVLKRFIYGICCCFHVFYPNRKILILNITPGGNTEIFFGVVVV